VDESGGGDRMYGSYTNTLDSKGRVFVPATFREDLGESFILTRGAEEKSVYIYSNEEWENFLGKLKNMKVSKGDNRKVIRYFCKNAVSCTPDSQGRIVIPQNLREKAGLIKNVLFIGTGNRVEVWEDEVYEGLSDDDDIPEILESNDIDF